MTGLLHAEARKVGSTRLWWGLLIPVAVLSVLLNLFSGLVSAGIGTAPGTSEGLPLVLASVAYALTLTSVFAALFGLVATAGEFRHRTITTTYLTAPGRGRVLAAKTIAAAAVGAGYALVTVLVGVVAGLLGQSGGSVPVGSLLGVAAIGVAVCALWGAIGAALGTLLPNPAAAVAVLLGYLLVVEGLLSLFLATRDSAALTAVGAYLPGNAGDVALYDLPARAIAGPELGPGVVAALSSVADPLTWWGSLIVLVAWTVTAAAAGWVVGGRRDVT